jgi:excisionase family DNA binding protein
MSRHAIAKTVPDESGSEAAGRAGPHRRPSRSVGVGHGDQSEQREHDLSPTGELVVGLQEQVQTLTMAVHALAKRIPARLVSVHEAAEALGVSCATIRRKVKAGEIPCRRIGKAVRIDISKLRAMDSDEVQELARRARSH